MGNILILDNCIRFNHSVIILNSAGDGIIHTRTMPTQIPFSLLPATWRDIRALHELEKTCFGEDAWPWIELIGVLTLPGTVRIKAVVKGEMAGFIAGDNHRGADVGWILTIGVLPVFRRQGIARALLADCEQQMKVTRVKLSVRRSNQAAITLYQKLGYNQVEVWSKYYHNGEDGLVLEKTIK